MTDAKTAMRELTLALIYLSRFSGDKRMNSPEEFHAWKGYSFDVLDALDEADLIWQGSNPHRTKSVCITEEGVAAAKELLQKYGISDWNESAG